MSVGAYHHPDRKEYPEWVIYMKNFLFHKVVTIVQRMLAHPENLAYIRGFIDALEWEYLIKRRALDIEEKIGVESGAVEKAIKEAEAIAKETITCESCGQLAD